MHSGSIMPQRHRRKRAACRSSANFNRNPSLAATLVAVALLSHGTPNSALAERGDDSSRGVANANRILHGRRARAAGSVRRGDTSSSADRSIDKVNLLIKYKNGLARRRSLSNHVNSNATTLDTWEAHTVSIATISEERHISAVEIDANEIDFVLEEMMLDDHVELVEEDFPMYKYAHYSIQDSPSTSNHTLHLRNKQRHLAQHHPQQNRTLSSEQQLYGISQIQADAVWDITKRKPNTYPNTPVKVCIVDTGYDMSHEDLPQEGVTFTNTGYGDPLEDGDGHGTHCAGVIGALGNNMKGVVGVNPDPTKFSFHISKALNAAGLGTASSVLKGIQGCISSGAKVISMSLGGGPKSPIFRELYLEAYAKDVLVFAAAGNVGVMRDDYPASYGLVVSVGAVDQQGKRANFSNWNNQVELMGPGVDIESTYPGGYATLSGTSMATPYVAGVAALVWGYFPACSNQQIRNVLAKSAKSMTGTVSRECNLKTGFGLVQAKSAFDLLDKFGCAAGGKDTSPRSAGGVGGCRQPLADITTLTPQSGMNTASFGPSGNGCKTLFLSLLTDKYAYETSWKLKRVDTGQVVKYGPAGDRNFEDDKEYTSPVSSCLDPGVYEFTIEDIYGDGIDVPGYYSISLDGKTLRTNSNFGDKETTRFTIENSAPSIVEARQPEWTLILKEEFATGFGNFNDGGTNAMYARTKFGRNGLVMIKEGTTGHDQSSVYSNNIQITNKRDYSKFKVVFSFYANNMETGDKFCLDYSVNGAAAWSRTTCWTNGRDFENGQWNDNVVREFRPAANTANSIRIRFHGLSEENNDRVFLDEIQLFGKTELTR